MDLSKYSTEELYNHLKGCEFQVDILGRNIKRLQQQQQDLCDDELEYQSEIDKRELTEIIDAKFEVQLEYFLRTYSHRRSNKHVRCCDKFFDMLSLRVEPRAKAVRFKAHPDFIKANRGIILQYLPIVFEYCYQKLQMETTPFHMITIENNPMVDRITYYPLTKNYFTDGTYLRQHNTLESALDHMMEVE